VADRDNSVASLVESTFTGIINDNMPGMINDRYRHNLKSYGALGEMRYGREDLMERAISFLSVFPDARVTIGKTLWAEDSPAEYRVSTRWRLDAHHRGNGAYGVPTGNAVGFTGITNAHVCDGRICEQWTEYDRRTLVRQICDESEYLTARLTRNAESWFSLPFGEVERARGQLPPETRPEALTIPSGNSTEESLTMNLLHEIWNRRLVGAVDRYYAKSCLVHAASGEEVEGHEDLQAYILSLMAPFPDLALLVDDLILQDGSAGHSDAAVRWSLVGTHRGHGRYGEPTGARVRITGITHQTILGGQVTEEWTEFGDLDLMERLARARCVEAGPNAETLGGTLNG